MNYAGISDFLAKGKAVLAKGPVALIFVEDLVEVESTLRHHQAAGFTELVVFAPGNLGLPPKLADKLHLVDFEIHRENAVPFAVNRLIEAAPGTWFYYCYNSEYLFHPFCETRNVRELIGFHTEERRDAMLTYVVDLYAGDLNAYPNAVSLEHSLLDRSGYYALGRHDENGEKKDRQLNFYGGLRWRFEEHIPQSRRKIDRIGLFKAKKGLALQPDHTFNDEEYNTYACPWHHNLTAAICSFRTAKALRTNPGSKFDIHSFRWRNSVEFKWHSQQLMDLGLMEPGQWF